MAKLVWTDQALDDLEAVALFIEKDSSHYAQLLVSKVFDSVAILTTFPESGRVVPEINNPRIREIILGNYRIIYRLGIDLIEIITVYHSSRLLREEDL